jgi:hypothetical protein
MTNTTDIDHGINAVRTWSGDKATITVTLPDGWAWKMGRTTWQAKGKRAATAEVVVVGVFKDFSRVDIIGCRSDRQAAVKEVARLKSMTSWQHQGYEMPATPYEFAEVVSITEAG